MPGSIFNQQGVFMKVAICGGTHGNELTGIHLVRRWQKTPSEIQRNGLELSTLIANPAAYQQNRRYVDNDLNRRFSLKDLNDPSLQSVEELRAKEINQILGTKESPKVDFIFDLHTTTANMGLSVIINSLDPLVKKAAFYIAQKLPDVTLFYQDSDRNSDNFLMSLAGKGGLLIEVGPIAQGLLRAEVFEQTRLAVMAGLDYLEMHLANEAPEVPEQLPGFQFVEKIKFPEDENGQLIGMIHPELQDKDYQPLNPGDPMYLLETGETVYYQGEPGLVPSFINEAAYYDQHHSMSLMKPITIKL